MFRRVKGGGKKQVPIGIGICNRYARLRQAGRAGRAKARRYVRYDRGGGGEMDTEMGDESH